MTKGQPMTDDRRTAIALLEIFKSSGGQKDVAQYMSEDLEEVWGLSTEGTRTVRTAFSDYGDPERFLGSVQWALKTLTDPKWTCLYIDHPVPNR